MSARRFYLEQTWSAQEDEILLQAVSKYGVYSWKSVKTLLPYKTWQQCLQRFNAFSHTGLSTPDVLRFLRQHNGDTQLAAVSFGTTEEAIQKILADVARPSDASDADLTTKLEQRRMQQELDARMTNKTSKYSRKHNTAATKALEQQKVYFNFLGFREAADDLISALHDKMARELTNTKSHE